MIKIMRLWATDQKLLVSVNTSGLFEIFDCSIRVIQPVFC